MPQARLKKLLSIASGFGGLAIFYLAIVVLVREFRTISFNDIVLQFNQISFSVFALAIFLTCASYLLLTLYDLVALRYAGSSLSYRHIAPVSFTAIAIGHNVGIASLSGGAIRYRAYSLAGITATDIATAVLFITLTFGLGISLLLGIVLLVEPASVLSPIPISITAVRFIGVAMLLFSISYLVLLFVAPSHLLVRKWTFRLPTLKTGITQIALAAIDLILCSLVLFVFLHASVELPYVVFLGVFILSIVVGLISTVPGGLGVFESAMVLLLPQIPVPILLSCIFAYRLVYYLAPLFLAVLLIIIHEAREHKTRLRALSEATFDWAAGVTPQALSAAVFIAGAYLLVRGSIPMQIGSSNLMDTVVPLPLLEMSHLLSSIIGAALLLVAHGLHRRLQRAWFACVVLLSSGIVAAVIQYTGIVQVSIMTTLLVLAVIARAEFYRGKFLLELQFDTAWIVNILFVLLAVIGVAMIAHKNIEYSNELWWQFTLNGEASRAMRGALAGLLIVGMFSLARLLQRAPPKKYQQDQETLQSVKQLVGASHSSFPNIALLGDKRFFFNPTKEAFIMYQISGGSWIALSDPVGKAEQFQDLLWQFREACDAENARCVFYQVSDDFLPIYIDLGLTFLKLGEEGVVDLKSFGLEGSNRADLRQAVSKAKRSGASFSIMPKAELGSVIERLEAISNEWLGGKSAEEKGFSLGYFDRQYMSEFDCALVRVDGEVIAFANLWKGTAGSELSVDLMRYSSSAPNGIMDYLFTEIMLWGKANGFSSFNLGMAPLSGFEKHALAPPWQKFGNLIYRFGENFYNFEGLRNYKDKFEPQWTPKYLACKGGLQIPAVLFDTTILISGGVASLVTK